MVRRLLQDNKVPGTSVGTRAAAAPGTRRVCHRTLRREPYQWLHPLPNKFLAAPGETWLLEVAGRVIRTKTVDAGWGELRVGL